MDAVVLALEGAIAPMDCFVDDRDARVPVLASHRRRALRHQAALDARADGRHQVAAAHHLGRARRVRGLASDSRHPLGDPWLTSRSRTCTSPRVTSRSSRGWTSTSAPERSTPSWARTARASPRWPTRSWAIPGLEVTEGQILFNGEDITEADPDERARAGLFMAFQYPVAIPGVTTAKYLRMVMNAHREARGEQPVSAQGLPQDGRGRDGAHARAEGVLVALHQRRLLRRREEAHGDPPARAPGARAGRARRDRLRPRHRRAEHRLARRQHRRGARPAWAR